jgi:hypothetical protein
MKKVQLHIYKDKCKASQGQGMENMMMGNYDDER